jgi:hypothetical protein
LLKILYKKLQPEQIYFWYDFFYNNCSTIPRDILNEVLDGQIQTHFESTPAELSLREYVRRNLNEWSIVAFFLDIILNSDVDGKISAWTEMFHPFMLQKYLNELPQFDDNGKAISGTHLLTEHHTVVQGGEYPSSPLNFFLSVLITGFLFLGAFLFLSWKRSPKATLVLGGYCIAFGIFSGFFGTVLLAGWLFSNHHMLHHNVNLFLFWPLDFVFIRIGVFFLQESRFHLSKIWRIYTGLHLLALVSFVFAYFLNLFGQDLSNVVYFLSPLAGISFLVMLRPKT